jgi:hypothetical protein
MKTYNDLLVLVSILNQEKVESGSKAELKLKKIIDKIKPFLDTYNEKREDIKLEHAYADKNGILELNEKGEYKYTKDGIRGINSDYKKLLEQFIDFEPLDLGKDGIEHLEFLSGWVKGI